MSNGSKKSRRQELGDYANSGDLRQHTERWLSSEASDLLVDIVLRYCESRRPWRRSKKS